MADRVSVGIELTFDPDTESRLRKLWQRMEDAGVPTLARHTHRQHRPHVSVAVADWIDLAVVRDAVASVTPPPRIPVQLTSVGMFPGGVMWLGVVMTQELMDFHRAVHDQLHGVGVVSQAYYRPGRWTPHCTLAPLIGEEHVSRAFRVALAELPLSGWLVGAWLARHTADAAEYHPMLTFP